MENINELFEYIEKTSDDELRYQLIDFMKKHYIIKAQQVGSSHPDNRFKLKLRRVSNDVKNLAELIDFCFQNDFKLVGNECETGQNKPTNEFEYETLQSLSKKLKISVPTLNNSIKSGDLKCLIYRGTGKKNKMKRFTPEQIKDYSKTLNF